MSVDKREEVVAQKVLSKLKNPQWNIPDLIQLDTSKRVIVGRAPVNKDDQNATGVMLHSTKLPSMMSRKHASIEYSNETKQWTVEDLKSVNGVYVNDEKISPGVGVPVKNGDVICFGINSLRNVFKFSLDGNVLKRTVRSTAGADTSQEAQPTKNVSIKNQPVASVKNQDQSQTNSASVSNQDQSSSRSMRAKRKSEENNDATASKKIKFSDEALPTLTTTDKAHLQPSSATKSPSVSPSVGGPASSKPSPALSSKSTPEVNMDALFEDCKEEAEDTLDEAIFGSTVDSKTASSKLLPELDTKHLDATAIQIQMAKKAMESEKHKLISSIAALKSELAAKDQLLAKKEEVEKKEKENESVISSMQEEFTCVICQELFINAYTLPCAHSFCEWCIKEWTKKKKQRNCPICRKPITSDPVHSLVLDNAIEKMVSKLSDKEREERKKEEEEHKEALKGLSVASAPSLPTSSSAHPSTTASRRGRGRGRARRGTSTPRGRRVGTSHTTVHVPEIIVPDIVIPDIVIPDIVMPEIPGPWSSSSASSRDDPIVIDDDEEEEGPTESASSTDASDTSSFSSSSDSSVSGYSEAYYGGYGRCFNCGRRGHWAPGCPY